MGYLSNRTILEKADLVLLSTWGYPVTEVLLRKAAARLLQAGRLTIWHQETAPAPAPGDPVLSALLKT